MNIRTALKRDYETIYELVKTAFETAQVSDGTEQDFVLRLRDSSAFLPELEFVAEENGLLIGHILLTRQRLCFSAAHFTVWWRRFVWRFPTEIKTLGAGFCAMQASRQLNWVLPRRFWWETQTITAGLVTAGWAILAFKINRVFQTSLCWAASLCPAHFGVFRERFLNLHSNHERKFSP